MEIYFVRHGETSGNVARRHQAESTSLSKVGEQQARDTAEQLKLYKPTHLVTSSLVRTVETARIISEVTGLIPDTNQNLIELRRPDNMYGYRYNSPKSIRYFLRWYFGFEKAREANGESYEEFRQRLTIARTDLSKYPKDARLVVVSHAAFISFFVGHMCQGDRPLTPLQAIATFRRLVSMPNASVTPILLDREEDVDSCAWSVNG